MNAREFIESLTVEQATAILSVILPPDAVERFRERYDFQRFEKLKLAILPLFALWEASDRNERERVYMQTWINNVASVASQWFVREPAIGFEKALERGMSFAHDFEEWHRRYPFPSRMPDLLQVAHELEKAGPPPCPKTEPNASEKPFAEEPLRPQLVLCIGCSAVIESPASLCDECRERAYALLKADRVKRNGEPQSDENAVQRDVVASHALSGIDARPHFGGRRSPHATPPARLPYEKPTVTPMGDTIDTDYSEALHTPTEPPPGGDQPDSITIKVCMNCGEVFSQDMTECHHDGMPLHEATRPLYPWDVCADCGYTRARHTKSEQCHGFTLNTSALRPAAIGVIPAEGNREVLRSYLRVEDTSSCPPAPAVEQHLPAEDLNEDLEGRLMLGASRTLPAAPSSQLTDEEIEAAAKRAANSPAELPKTDPSDAGTG